MANNHNLGREIERNGDVDIELMYQLETILSNTSSDSNSEPNIELGNASNSDNSYVDLSLDESDDDFDNFIHNPADPGVLPIIDQVIAEVENEENEGNAANVSNLDSINEDELDAVFQSEIQLAMQASLDDGNFSRFQTNIDQTYQQAGEVIEYSYPVLPISMDPNYESMDTDTIENSNQIILPQYIFNDLSKYNNIQFPLVFKFENCNLIVSVKDIKLIQVIYVPYRVFNKLEIEPGQECTIQLLNNEFPKGTKVVLQASTSDFLEIENHKDYLEKELCSRYTYLTQGETITLPLPEYLRKPNSCLADNYIQINIIKTEPAETIYIIDTDLEVETLAPLDYVAPPQPQVFKTPPRPPTHNNNSGEVINTYRTGGLEFCISERVKKEGETHINSSNTLVGESDNFSGVGNTVRENADTDGPKEDEIEKIRQIRLAKFTDMMRRANSK